MPTLKLLPSPCNRPVIELTIDNKPYKFLIDTGATHTFLIPEIVTVITRPIGNVHTAGGSFKSNVADVRFNFAGVSIQRVFVCDEVANEPLRVRTSGIIGQDLLQQFKRVIIDNRQKTITFEL